MAAGAQITHSQNIEEVVTKNNETVLYEAGHRNGYNLNPLTSIYERASLVPAAAVIPALKMHRIIAAVKKLVVGSVQWVSVHLHGCVLATPAFTVGLSRRSLHWLRRVADDFTLNKSECLIQAFRLNVLAWNNRKGFRFYFIGFWS
jgi:hypothetical protein